MLLRSWVQGPPKAAYFSLKVAAVSFGGDMYLLCINYLHHTSTCRSGYKIMYMYTYLSQDTPKVCPDPSRSVS